MKKFFLLAGLLYSFFSMAQEIQFEKSTWSEIKAKAKEKNKLVFLDAYTSWCGPCKSMAKKTFTDAEVAAFFNEKFINAKIDMEKGEGPEIAKTYDVNCYPNLLFIDGDGNLVHRSAGFMEAKDFLLFGKDALIPEKTFTSVKKQFEADNFNPAKAKHYFELLSGSCLPANAEAVKYLSSLKENELLNQENWSILNNYVTDAHSAPFQYLIKNSKEFSEKHAAEKVNNKIFNTYMNHGNRLINNEKLDTASFTVFLNEIKASGFERAGELLLSLNLEYAARIEDWKLYFESSAKLASTAKKDDAMFLNNVSWTIFERSNEKTQLAEAELWAKRSVELQEEAFNLDTYANLLFKNGKKAEAVAKQKRAIEIIKAAGENASDFEETLKKFEKQQ